MTDDERQEPQPDDDAPDTGRDEVTAAARARGLRLDQVRSEQLLTGQRQHLVRQAPHDPRPRQVLGALVLATVAAVVGVVAGLADLDVLQGVAIGAALLLVAVAMVLVATRLLPEELVVQQRDHRRPTRPTGADGVEAAPSVLGRRPILAAVVAALGTIGAAVLVPFRGVGPSSGDLLRVSAWQDGARCVDDAGRVVRDEDVPVNGIVTVWPEGHVGDAQAQAVLLRIDPDLLTPGTLAHGTPDGLVAYSKTCTHAGCAIAQFSADDRPPDIGHALVCPCHQSVFDVTDQAAPAGGPATRPLAQLPVAVDASGAVVATGDFLEPPGPAWWSR